MCDAFGYGPRESERAENRMMDDAEATAKKCWCGATLNRHGRCPGAAEKRGEPVHADAEYPPVLIGHGEYARAWPRSTSGADGAD